MKNRMRVVLVASASIPLLFAGTALAQSSDQPATQNKATESVNAEALQKRVQARKVALKTKLAELEKKKIQTKCKASQAVIKGVNQRVSTAAANHTKAFDKVDSRLTNLVTRLEAQNIDATQLKTQHAELKTKIAAYKDSLNLYKQNLGDTSGVECMADPEGFKASLETARTTRQQLAQQVADIRTYINKTIKPTLVELRSKVATTKADETDGSAAEQTEGNN